jgi:hypothetical protein
MKESPIVDPALRARQIELAPGLLKAVKASHDTTPGNGARSVPYAVDRAANPDCFAILDAMMDIDCEESEMFTAVTPVNVFGEEFGDPGVMLLHVKWVGFESAIVTVSYTSAERKRMAAEEKAKIDGARSARLAELPTLAEYLDWHGSLRTEAWFPRIAAGAPAGITSSRYYGEPWLPDAMEWPSIDGVPLAFALQINVGELPERARAVVGGEGLVALFMVPDDVPTTPDEHNAEYGEWLSFVVRVDTRLPGRIRHHPDGRRADTAVPVEWVAGGDWPSHIQVRDGTIAPGTMKALSRELAEALPGSDRLFGSDASGEVTEKLARTADAFWGEGSCDPGTAARAVDQTCFGGDKIGGWPAINRTNIWLKHEGRRMRNFLQIDTAGPVHAQAHPVLAGRAHVFVDQLDPSVLKLSYS